MLNPDNDKQIKEMANDLEEEFVLCGTLSSCGTKRCSQCFSKYLYEQGYRKLPKDSIALSMEEFKKYIFIKQNIEQSGILGWIKEEREKERKETAEKILEKGKYNMPEWLKDWIVEQFGVEIKESGDE